MCTRQLLIWQVNPKQPKDEKINQFFLKVCIPFNIISNEKKQKRLFNLYRLNSLFVSFHNTSQNSNYLENVTITEKYLD